MYYINVEDDRVISSDEIRSEFERLQDEGLEDKETSFGDYIRNCLTRHNGSLEPLTERINSLKRQKATAERLNDTAEVEKLTAQIKALEALTKEEHKHE